MKDFRTLTASDVEVRIGNQKKNEAGKVIGYSLLLYKNARVDMQVLSTTLGVENWMRKHTEIAGNVYCSVGIRTDNGEWIWKEDCGYCQSTNGEMSSKGTASDSFKRACVNWGIGTELYTAPFIWLNSSDTTARYEVSEMEVSKDKVITKLVIVNSKDKSVVFSFSAGTTPILDQARKLKTADEVLKLYEENQEAIEADNFIKEQIVALGKELRAKEKAAA
jgi:hypothetical protein